MDSWFKLILIQIVKFVGFRKITEIGLKEQLKWGHIPKKSQVD